MERTLCSHIDKPYKNDFKIQMKKKARTFHANMLEKYIERESEKQQACVSSIIEYDEDCLNHEEMVKELETREFTESKEDFDINPSLSQDQTAELKNALNEYSSVFKRKPGLAAVEDHKTILTTNKPIAPKAYPVPFHLRDALKKELTEMEEEGIIRKSNSPYASPVVFVKKIDSSLRICPDYRKLNKVTIFDPEPMPSAEDLIQKMGKAKFFSKLERCKEYWQ